MSYNGWTNQQTWNANLWTDGEFTDAAVDACETCDNKAEALESLETYIQETFDSMIDDSGIPQSGFLWDVLTSAICDINCREIAEAYIDDNWTDEDEDEEDEDED